MLPSIILLCASPHHVLRLPVWYYQKDKGLTPKLTKQDRKFWKVFV
jgi:hypothetical protein